MKMLKYIFLLFINLICTTTEVSDNTKYKQQLLFGQDTKPKLVHWCDIKIIPKVKIYEVTIFLKSNSSSDKDSAVAQVLLLPKKSPITPNAFRVLIPSSIIKNSSYQYTFQFSNYDSTFLLFSEPFIYDSALQNFCLLSGSRNVFFTKQRIIIILLSSLSLIVVFILGLVLKKKICNKKTNL